MIKNNFFHIFYYLKLSKNTLIKIFNNGTNSKNCFFKKNKKYFFSIILKKNNLKKIKIIQNTFIYNISKIIFFIKNFSFYKKNIGNIINYSNIEFCCKIIFLICNFYIKKKNYKKNFLNIFIIKIKNFILKKIFFKKKIINSFFISHNDIFKDNVLILGIFLITILDFNNFSFVFFNNDLLNVLLNFTNNYCINYVCINENFNKKKKIIINYFFIINIYLLRIIKLINFKKTKKPINYIKKFFYEK